MYASLSIIAYTLFLSYHSYVYALSFIIACTFLLSCHAICIVYATLPFLCALNIQMRTQINFCINVNSDRFSESAFEFVLITVLSLHFYIIVHIVDS